MEINDQVPHTHGETVLHVSQVDAFIETSHPFAECPPPEVSPVHRAIASRAASLIPDGATIQTGIGSLPQAVLEFLRDHKDLGIHSELIGDGVIDLIEAGIMNNWRKTLHRHKAVSGFALGTRRLFDFIDHNPVFEFRPTSYTNDPFVIAQNDHMVAINSAIEVDIAGQVCSDSWGACHTAASAASRFLARRSTFERGHARYCAARHRQGPEGSRQPARSDKQPHAKMKFPEKETPWNS